MGRKKNAQSAVADAEAAKSARREAVRQAVQALGSGADIPELAAWIKENASGVEVDNRQIGVFRYHFLPKKPRKRKPGRPRKSEATATSNGPAPKAKAAPSKGMIAVEDMVVVKELVGRYGDKGLRTMLDLLAK